MKTTLMAVSGWYANPRSSVILAGGSGGFAQPVLYTIPLGARDPLVVRMGRGP